MKVQARSAQRPSVQYDQLDPPEEKPRPRLVSRRALLGLSLTTAAAATGVVQYWDEFFLKRFAEVEPGQVYRAAWQARRPIGRLVETYGIKSILSLSVMGVNEEKYKNYAEVARARGVDWVLMPVVGSYMTLPQMAEAADWIAQLPRPLLFHCVAGHHRSTQAQSAWRMRHGGWSAKQAWAEVSQYRWTNPTGDIKDHSLVERFAASAYLHKGTGYEPTAFDALDGPGHRRVALGPDGQLLGMATRH